GFFYIPGTETCLKISGYIFYEIGAASDPGSYHPYSSEEYTKYIRARLNFDARSETEWGTLQSYIRAQADYTDYSPGRGNLGLLGGVTNGYSNDPDLGLDQAWLSLGGFRVGYTESAFTYTPNGGASGFGTHSWYGLNYGYSQRMLVQYNFSGGNGFFGTISLEHDDTADLVLPGVGTIVNGGTGDYVPDIVGKIGVTQGWGTVWGTVAYDSDNGSASLRNLIAGGPLPGAGDDEFAASAGLHLNIPNSPGSSFRLIGYYASGANSFWSFGEWSVLASYYQQFTPTFGASLGAQYIADTNFDLPGSPDLWLAELNMVWTPVNEFEVRSEITYAKESDLDGSVSGFVRFTR